MRRRKKAFLREIACTIFMDTVLDAPFRLECGRDVERARQCCYRIRERYRCRGDTRYDGLRFRIVNGTELEICNLERSIDITVEKILSEMSEWWEGDRMQNDAG